VKDYLGSFDLSNLWRVVHKNCDGFVETLRLCVSLSTDYYPTLVSNHTNSLKKYDIRETQIQEPHENATLITISYLILTCRLYTHVRDSNHANIPELATFSSDSNSKPSEMLTHWRHSHRVKGAMSSEKQKMHASNVRVFGLTYAWFASDSIPYIYITIVSFRNNGAT